MSEQTLVRRDNSMDIKRISVSKKRQITIPQKFYEKLHIGDEVECIIANSELIIRPVRQETEFAEDILKDLITKGVHGEQLLEEFKKVRSNIRPATKRIIEEAENAADELKGSGDDIMKDIFAEDE